MPRRNIQQPRPPGQARKLVTVDRKLQTQRQPSSKHCYGDLKVNFDLGGTGGTIVPTGVLAVNLGGTGADTGQGALDSLFGSEVGDNGKVATVVTGSVVLASPGAASPEDVTFSYNADGTVDEIDFATSLRNLAFTYNADGSVATIVDSDPSHTKTFSYNADGTLDTITV